MENQNTPIEIPAHSENNMQMSMAGDVRIPADLQAMIERILAV